MQIIYKNITNAMEAGKKLLAVLIDPDKVDLKSLPVFFDKVHQSITTHILVGGSTDIDYKTEQVVKTVKRLTQLPVILFPGDYSQITEQADGLLFLSLLSGRNPEYLIEQHIKAVPKLEKTNLEIIPTGYLLLNGGVETAVQRVSQTKPISQQNIELITNTAMAGAFSGKQLIYLEAGSGARHTVHPNIIKAVKQKLKIPLIVGGGIKTSKQVEEAYSAGADMIVIGTAFEKDNDFFVNIKK